VHAQTGEVLSAQVEKMSKSKKNVINPDVVLTKYGADTFRLYEMFMGTFDQAKPWDMRSIEGSARFLRRVWTMVLELEGAAPAAGDGAVADRHRAIKKVTEDLELFGFNTCIAALMSYSNEIQKQPVPTKIDLETLLILLNPFAPHITEELWSKLGHDDLLCRQAWPAWDAKFLIESTIEYAVQVNGKLRSTFSIAADAAEAAILDAALADAKVIAAIDGKTMVKKIVVPKKLVNLVVK
jgi:leucyl-tRNA synthetase